MSNDKIQFNLLSKRVSSILIMEGVKTNSHLRYLATNNNGKELLLFGCFGKACLKNVNNYLDNL
jgi:hypothetical protein